MLEIARIQLAQGLDFTSRKDRVAYNQTILTGARYAPELAERIERGEFRRMLDLGCGEGAFAVWVWSLNPRVWVDAVELDPELRHLATLNAPPGTKVMAETDGDRYDLIRQGDRRLFTMGKNFP